MPVQCRGRWLWRRIKEYADLLGDGRGKAHDRDEYIAADKVKEELR